MFYRDQILHTCTRYDKDILCTLRKNYVHKHYNEPYIYSYVLLLLCLAFFLFHLFDLDLVFLQPIQKRFGKSKQLILVFLQFAYNIVFVIFHKFLFLRLPENII